MFSSIYCYTIGCRTTFCKGSFHQVYASYNWPIWIPSCSRWTVLDGHPERTFLVHISWSKDASVTPMISLLNLLKNFLYLNTLMQKKFLAKEWLLKLVVVLVPGQFNVNFRTIAQSYRFYLIFFPGLLNRTEIGQEMDKLFSKLKMTMEENQDNLYKKLFH